MFVDHTLKTLQTAQLKVQGVPLATDPGISLIILPLMTIRRTTDTFLFNSHTTNVLLFIFRCNIFIGFRIINHLTPNGHFSGRTAPLKLQMPHFLFIQQINVLNILNMLHTLRFFLFKMSFIS